MTQKCRNCEIDGQTGTGKLKTECRSCLKSGRVNCARCGGLFSGKEGDCAVFRAAGVFTTAPCPSCRGGGWPYSRMALACPGCLGLGVLVRPAADPSKTLE